MKMDTWLFWATVAAADAVWAVAELLLVREAVRVWCDASGRRGRRVLLALTLVADLLIFIAFMGCGCDEYIRWSLAGRGLSRRDILLLGTCMAAAPLWGLALALTTVLGFLGACLCGEWAIGAALLVAVLLAFVAPALRVWALWRAPDRSLWKLLLVFWAGYMPLALLGPAAAAH